MPNSPFLERNGYFPSKQIFYLLNIITMSFSLFRAKDSVKHFHVEYTGYSFKFGFNEYSSLKDFVKHFANQPLIGSETGELWTDSWTGRCCCSIREDQDRFQWTNVIVVISELYHMLCNLICLETFCLVLCHILQ